LAKKRSSLREEEDADEENSQIIDFSARNGASPYRPPQPAMTRGRTIQ